MRPYCKSAFSLVKTFTRFFVHTDILSAMWFCKPLLVFLLSSLIATAACKPRVQSPTSAGFSPSKLGTVERDVTYGKTSGVNLKMDIYYPRKASGPVPVAVYVHGGAWAVGDKTWVTAPLDIGELVDRGYMLCAIDYRLAPRYKFPAQIEDVKCAIRFLRANASKYGIDPTRIGAWGESAGGHLVALLGVTDSSAGLEGSGGYADQSSRVQAVVDMFGPSDLTALPGQSQLLEQVFGTSNPESEALKRASPITYVSKDDPPFLILHGEMDDVIPLSQSQILYDRLVSAGVPATLVVVKNSGHVFVPVGGPITPTRAELTKMVADFFDSYLK